MPTHKNQNANNNGESTPIVAKPMRHKILRSFLLVSLLVLVLMTVAVVIYMFRLRNMLDQNTASSVGKMKQVYSKTFSSQLANVLLGKVSAKAQVVDDSIWIFKSRVEMLAGYATQIYTHPEHYRGQMQNPPLAENEGKLSLMLTYSNYANPNSPAIKAEAELLGAASDLLTINYSDSRLMEELFLETVSGVCLLAGKSPTQYIDSKGNPIPYNLNDEPYIRKVFEDGNTYISPLIIDGLLDEAYMTYTAPFYKGGKIAGVSSAAMNANGLFNLLNRAVGGETGNSFIVDINTDRTHKDRAGTLVYSTASSGILKYNPNNIVNLRFCENNELSKLAENCIANPNGFSFINIDGENFYVAYSEIPSAGWVLFMTFPEKVILSYANVFLEEITNNGKEALISIDQTIIRTVIAILVIFVFVVILLPFVARRLSYIVTKPITLLTKKVCSLKGDDLSFSWEHKTQDEVQVLAETFSGLVDRIKKYVADVVSVTSEKEKISTELGVATKIQADMLPKIFPAFPDRPEFEIFASMRPAKEVGGDFYDFFMVDKRHLAVVVADVSGKGVPAALFMVIGKTLIKDHTMPNVDLGKAFSEVNNLLFQANGDGMLITAFEGVLDLYSGEFRYVNAGHEPPYIWHNGDFQPRELDPAFMLAGIPNMKYNSGRIMLEPGDKLFQYTDGVTEATNAQEKLYGFDRLTAVLNAHGAETPCEIIKAVTEDVDAFVGDAPQFDDITMLCLDYKQRMEVGQLMVHEFLTVSAEPENLSRVQEFVTSTMKKGCASAESQSQMDIATEEVFINIASYAYSEDAVDNPVWIECSISGNEMVLTFKDKGVPYNPLEKTDPDIDAPIQKKKIGGLGIFMTKQLADSVEYEFSHGHNVLRLKKTIA